MHHANSELMQAFCTSPSVHVTRGFGRCSQHNKYPVTYFLHVLEKTDQVAYYLKKKTTVAFIIWRYQVLRGQCDIDVHDMADSVTNPALRKVVDLLNQIL